VHQREAWPARREGVLRGVEPTRGEGQRTNGAEKARRVVLIKKDRNKSEDSNRGRCSKKK